MAFSRSYLNMRIIQKSLMSLHCTCSSEFGIQMPLISYKLLRVLIKGKLDKHHHLICQQTKVRDVLETLLGKSVEYEEYRMRRKTKEFKRVLCSVIQNEFPSCYPHIISPVLFAAMEYDATEFIKFTLSNAQDNLQY
jgi:hypothetical protein